MNRRTPKYLGLLALVLVASAPLLPSEELPDPIPLRRVLLPPAKLAQELKRVKDGVLERLPRKDFERLVQQAARVKKARPEAPRLIEARYRARLGDQALAGTGEWKLVHPGTGAALLKLAGDPAGFSLTVEKPKLGDRDAVIAEFSDPLQDGKVRPLALLVEPPGEHTLTFGWTARADARPEGLFIDLRLPEAPAGFLDLDLPPDRVVTLTDGTLVAGPSPADGGLRRWRVALGGKAQLSLLLRKVGPTRPAGLLLSMQRSVQRLTPEGQETTTSFTLEALHQEVSELTVEFDPLLRPVAVAVPGLQEWTTQPGALTIQLGRPLREGVLEVRCVAPLGVPWTSPGLRLRNAVPRGETIELRLHPDLRFVGWQPGDFRLTDSAPVTDPETKLPFRRLTLLGGGLGSAGPPAAPTPRRPSGQLQAGGVEYRTRQLTWWNLRPQGMDLVTRIDYQVRQGQLFQLPLRLPAGWEVESVEVTPREALAGWVPRADKAGPLLVVSLRQPIRPTGDGGLTVRLRHGAAAVGQELPFPDVVPVGGLTRDGGLAIDFEEQEYRATARTPLRAAEPPAAGPWGKSVPDYFYPYRGTTLPGTLRLRPQAAQFRAHAHTDVLVTGGPAGLRALLDCRLALARGGGLPEFIDVRLPASEQAPWEWEVVPDADDPAAARRLRRCERLPGPDVAAALAPLGHRPLPAAVLAAARPPGTAWRLWLDPATQAQSSVTLRALRTLDADDASRWRVPLVTLLHPDQPDGEVTVRGSAADLVAAEATGLHLDLETTARRKYRYAAPQATLVVQARPQATPALVVPTIDRAELVSQAAAAGQLRHHFQFRVANWSQHTLPVVLPPQATLVAVGLGGLWLDRPDLGGEDGRVEVPVPAGPRPTAVELLYTTPVAEGWLWHRLDAPTPALPVAPLALTRRWLLPPDLLPVGDGRVRAVAGPAVGWRSVASRGLDLFRGRAIGALRGEYRDPLREREQALRDALAELRKDTAGAREPLAYFVEEVMTTETLGKEHPLLVDRLALDRAGISRASPIKLAAAPDDPLQLCDDVPLVFVATPAGVMLTTRAEEQRTPAVDRALTRAVYHDRDPSARFLTALAWLSDDAGAEADLLGVDPTLPGWTLWTPVAGQPATPLPVARRPRFAALGLALAALLTAGLLLARRWSTTARVRLLLAWLGFAGFEATWLPSALVDLAWWPFLAALAIALGWFFYWVTRRLRDPKASPSTITSSKNPVVTKGSLLGAGSAVGLLLLVAYAVGQAPRPEPETVFLLPEDVESAVLVPPRLVRQLESLARPAWTPAGAVLVAGDYDGKAVNGRAEFTATYQAHVFGDEPARLDLPLDGVQLVGDVLVDGVRAFPVAVTSPRPGYAVRLRGAGRHTLAVRFQAAVTPGTVDEGMRTVSLTLPPLVQNRLTFQGPADARFLRLLNRNGGQAVTADAGGPRLTADVGGVAQAVRVRWNQEPAKPEPARVEYQEAYLWDLRADASLLTGLVRFSVGGNAVTSLSLDLPAALEVRGVQVRRPAADKAADALRLSDWTVQPAGDRRELRLDFPVPVAGGVEALVEFVPRDRWPAEVTLPLPTPRGQPAADSVGYLAYRHQGLAVATPPRGRGPGARPALFAPAWPAASKPATTSLDYASSFRREAGQPPELRVQLRPAPLRLDAEATVGLAVGPAAAELRARLHLVAQNPDLAVVECELQSPVPVAVTGVTSVEGPAVSRWSQTGNRLLVWLEQTTGLAVLDVAADVPLQRPANEAPRLTLPCLRLVGQGQTVTQVTVTPDAGLALVPQGLKGLTATAALAYTTKEPSYAGTFLVQPGPPTVVEVQTTAKLEGSDVTFMSRVEYRHAGEVRAVGVRLRDWDGDAWLDPPAKTVAQRRERHRRSPTGRERAWDLELVPGVASPYVFAVRGRHPVEDWSRGVALPDVVVPGAAVRHTLVVEAGLEVEAHAGVEAAGPRAWVVKRPTTDGDPTDWTLRVRPRKAGADAAQVLAAEGRVWLSESQGYQYQVTFTVEQEAPGELLVRMPDGSEVQAVEIDGVPAAVRQAGEGKVGVTVPRSRGGCAVAVRYIANGSIDRPDLAVPRVVGAAAVPLLWTLDVPAGWEDTVASTGTRLGGGTTRRAVVGLQRARLALKRSRLLAIDGPRGAALGDAQRQFARAGWLAELALAVGANDSLGLSRQLAALQHENRQLAQEQGFDDVREEAETRRREWLPGDPVPPGDGWYLDRDEDAPIVRLAPAAEQTARAAVAFTGQWLVLLLAVWTVSMSGILRMFVRWLWPELVLLVGIAAWALVGPTAAVLGVVALATVGRLAIAARGLEAWLQRVPPAAGSVRPQG